MKLPSTLERFQDEILQKLAELEGRVTLNNFIAWVLQFTNGDQIIACKLFLELRYFTATDVQQLCTVLFSRLPEGIQKDPEHTLFVGLGDAADSGSMLLYHYRLNNDLPESSFVTIDALRDLLSAKHMRDDTCKNLVFIDDFIGTGGQATDLLLRELKEVLSMRDFSYIGFHALVGFADGAHHIRTATPIEVCVAHHLTERDKVFHEASNTISKDYFERIQFKERIEKYGQRLFPLGPLGYGGTQALISFYYNTPNNTLPVIWACENGWRPLLKRSEKVVLPTLDEHETLALTYLSSTGGRCLLEDILPFEDGDTLQMQSALNSIAKKHMARIIDDDQSQFLILTAKGERQALTLLSDKGEAARSRLRRCGLHFQRRLPKNPRTSWESFSQLRSKKSALVHLLETACRVGDLDTVLSLQRTASWLLLMEHALDDRIKLGELVLKSWPDQDLGTERGMIQVDDLGWSNVALGKYDKATQQINAGIHDLRLQRDAFGVCQGWRHLQAIKIRKGDILGAELGLRLVFGASCAIPDERMRNEMQAGVARGLANVSARLGLNEDERTYREIAELCTKRSGDHLHATSDIRPAARHVGVVAKEGPPRPTEALLLLLRHPLTSKNHRHAFGRQSTAVLSDEGKLQVSDAVRKVGLSLGTLKNGKAHVYSATAKGSYTLAQAIAQQYELTLESFNSLDSIDSGELTGTTEDEALVEYPTLMKKIAQYRQNEFDGYAIAFPGGEAVRDLTLRVAHFLIEVLYSDCIRTPCVVVGHNSSITAILNILEALDRRPMESSYHYYDVSPASLKKVVLRLGTGSIRIDNV